MAIPFGLIVSGGLALVKAAFGGGGLLGTVNSVIDAVAKKQMSADEAKAKVEASWAEAWAKAEAAWADAAAKMYAEAQETIRSSFNARSWVTRNAWAFVVISQTFVLLWYQVGIPVFIKIFGGTFPRTGDDLLQWAYLLVAGALGIGVWQMTRGTPPALR